MNRVSQFIYRMLVAIVLARPWLLVAEPVGKDAAEALAKGWLAEGTTHSTGGFKGHVNSVETHPGFHVIHLQPEGYIITADDDELEPVLAFADRGTFKFDPENPLVILLKRDLSARADQLREVKRVLASSGSTTAKPTSLSTAKLAPTDERILNQAAQAQKKWAGLKQSGTNRPHNPQVALASMRLHGVALTNALAASINTLPNDPVHIREFKIADGYVQLTHDSLGSVTIYGSERCPIGVAMTRHRGS